MKNLKLIIAAALAAIGIGAAATMYGVNTPAGVGGAGSLITGNLPVATGPHTLGDSNILPANLAQIHQTTQGDTNYTIPSTVNYVELGTAFTSARTNLLPCANALSPGHGIQIYDNGANLTVLNSLTVTTDPVNCPTDTLNGTTTNTAVMWSPGSALYAISDGIGNWSVHVAVPPEFSVDFANTFGGQIARVPGTNSCTLGSGSNNLSCSGVVFQSKDVGDVVTAEGCATNGGLFKTTLTAVTPGTGNAVMHDQPSVSSCGTVKLISQVTPATGGLGLQWGGTETFTTAGVATQQVTMADGGVGFAAVNAGGSGGTSGSCTTLTLNASGSTELQGVQATFTGTISVGGALTSINSVSSPGDYTSFNGGYTYDGSGRYENVPVTGCGLSGATVNIAFTEQVVTQTNIGVYASASVPCSNTLAASSTTTSNATVTPTFNCNSGAAVQWVGADNQIPQQRAFLAQTQAAVDGAPIAVAVNGIFMSSGSNPSLSVGTGLAAAVTGPAVWDGAGPLISGFYHITSGCTIASLLTNPPTGVCNDIFPVVDSNPSGASGGYFGWKGVVNQAGTFIRNISCWGDVTSTTLDRCITSYGSLKWATIETVFAQNLTGHLYGVGAGSNGCGTVQESNILFIRSFHVGNLSAREPVIGLDSAACGVGANNLVLDRLRSFQDPYYAVTIRPCVAGGGGNSAHIIMMTDIKIEKSGVDGTTGGAGGILINDTNADCTTLPFPSSLGAPVLGTDENGAGNIWVMDSDFSNPAINSYAVVITGEQASDINSVYVQANFTAAADTHGGGVLIQACKVSCIIDSPADDTKDWNLYVSAKNAGSISSGAVEFDGHGNTIVFFADPGLTIICSDGIGFMSASTGLCQSTAIDMVPGYKSRWYIPEPYNSNILGTGVSYGANTIGCYPIKIPYPGITISALGTKVTGVQAGGNFQMAIYTNGSWINPAAPVATTGNISTASSTTVSGTVNSGTASLSPGNYYICLNADNGTATFNQYQAYWGPTTIGAQALNGVMATQGSNVGYITVAQTFGIWPTFVGSTSWSNVNGNPIAIAFDVSSSP